MSSDALAWMAAEAGLPVLEDAPGGRVRANEAAAQVLGAQPSGDMPSSLAALLGIEPNDARLLQFLHEASAGRRVSAQVSGGTAHTTNWRLFAVPLRGDRRQIVAVPSGVEADASVARRAGAADLAAGVSHEVSNALAAILGWAELAQQLDDPQRIHEALALIETSARAARSTAQLMLDMVQEGRTPPEPLNVAGVVGEVARLLEPEARRRRVNLEVRVGQAGLEVRGCRGSLFTVVWNLALNAVEAVPPGGRVGLFVVADDATARLIVTDDGPGMGEAQRSRAFEPYFTTKQRGTGLGLALVRRAVDELSGRISLETAPGGGTRFVVDLPRADTIAHAPRKGRRQKAPRRSGVVEKPDIHNASILVVEDDVALRELVATALELRGARVTAVGSCRDALRLESAFDIAIVDFTLPDGRGDALLAELRKSRIVRIAVLMSGTEVPEVVRGGEPNTWLRKPFELLDLASAVSHLQSLMESSAADRKA